MTKQHLWLNDSAIVRQAEAHLEARGVTITDRLFQPGNIERERFLLSLCLKSDTLLGDVANDISGRDFILEKHGYIWRAMQIIALDPERGVDARMVLDELARMKPDWFNEETDSLYLAELMRINANPANVHTYTSAIAEVADRIRLIAKLDESVNVILDMSTVGMFDEVTASVVASIAEVGERSGAESVLSGDIMQDAIDHLEETRAGDAHTFNMGFENMDHTFRLIPGELTIMAGFSGYGKTSFFLNVGSQIAAGRINGEPIGVIHFSGEMTKAQVGRRILEMDTGVSADRQVRGTVGEGEIIQLRNAAQNHKENRVWPFYYSAHLTPMFILTKARQAIARYGLRHFVILVDGIYCMNLDDDLRQYNMRSKDIKEHLKFAIIAKQLQDAARALGAPVFTTHQFNTNGQRRKKGSRLPIDSDLREGTGMKEFTDNLLLMWLPRKFYPDVEGTPDDLMALHADKIRNQGCQFGRWHFAFDRKTGYAPAVAPDGWYKRYN